MGPLHVSTDRVVYPGVNSPQLRSSSTPIAMQNSEMYTKTKPSQKYPNGKV